MKAIKGLEDRLYALDQMIASCKKLVNEQKELAQVSPSYRGWAGAAEFAGCSYSHRSSSSAPSENTYTVCSPVERKSSNIRQAWDFDVNMVLNTAGHFFFFYISVKRL